MTSPCTAAGVISRDHLEESPRIATFCVAGKFSLANAVLSEVLRQFPNETVVGLPNDWDDGERETWQPSFARELRRRAVPIVSEEECAGISDLILVSCEYERLIRLESFRSDCLYNVHFSLLPAHKGSFPVPSALLAGDEFVGVTLHRIDHGIDTGPVLDATAAPIGPDSTALDLYMWCQVEGARLVGRNLAAMARGATGAPQPREGSTFTSKRSIDFDDLKRVELRATAEQVRRKVAAANFRPFQLATFGDANISGVVCTDERSTKRHGTVVFESATGIRVSTIDFDVVLLPDRYPSLWDAARTDDAGTITALATDGLRLDEWDSSGHRALHHAITSGAIDAVAALVQGGASLGPLNGVGEDARVIAARDAPAAERSGIIRILSESTNA